MSATAKRVTPAAPMPAALAGWALLAMDGVTLALPQKEIAAIELISALQPPRADAGHEIGWLAQGAEHWPVYCLNRRFALAPALAQAARVCVLLRAGERTLGLAGTQVSLLAADAELSVESLPACLTQPGSPLIGLALHRDGIVMSVRVRALADFLNPLEAAHGS